MLKSGGSVGLQTRDGFVALCVWAVAQTAPHLNELCLHSSNIVFVCRPSRSHFQSRNPIRLKTPTFPFESLIPKIQVRFDFDRYSFLQGRGD